MSSLNPATKPPDPTVASEWPLLSGLMARAKRARSPRLGRFMRGLVLRLALGWLALAVSWALLRVAAQQAGGRVRG